MQKFIITIGREFGSQGNAIGKMLAEAYQVPYYDKNYLDEMIMLKQYITRSNIDHLDELFKSGLPISLWSGSDKEMLRKIYEYQSRLIESYARESGGIFIGRCSDYILKDFPNHLSVFFYAPIGVRVNYLMNKYGLNLDSTKTLIERLDQSRHNYYKYFTKENRGDRHNKQLFLDSSLLGVFGSAELLKMIIDRKYS